MPPKVIFQPGAAVDPADSPYDELGLKREASAPCQLSCPAGIDIPSYIALIAQGRFDEAVRIIRQDHPFPWVCGLICPKPCEAKCQRRYLDEPVRIMDLKGFAAKQVMEEGSCYEPLPPKNRFHERVAVVGSGPAGLSAAYFLAWEGYPVTIFESMPVPGGMMITGIPEYRLPRYVVQQEITSIEAMGVEIKVNTTIGKDLTLDNLRNEGFKAFFIAIGAWQGYKLGIQGENQFNKVLDALTFLKNVSFGNRVKPADHVAVIGGGNAAIDAARTCVRLGCSSVTILYRRTRSEMPAHSEEITAALEEGVRLKELVIPKRVIGHDGSMQCLECLNAKLGEPDESGRRSPIPVDGSEFEVPIGALICAIGQRPQTGEYPGFGEIDLTRSESIRVKSHNQQTNIEDVFAGGDVVTGPATVVEAIGAGKRAARAINAYIRGEPLPQATAPVPKGMMEPVEIRYKDRTSIKRRSIPTIEHDRRIKTFDQVELGLDKQEALKEAARCMRCDICERCWKCTEVCSEKLQVSAIKFIEAEEKTLILKDYDDSLPRCIGCGSCVNICPTGALQILDSNGQRLLLMTGAIINEMRMNKCSGCGIYYVPEVLQEHVDKQIPAPKEAFYRNLCPQCRRTTQAARMVGSKAGFDQ